MIALCGKKHHKTNNEALVNGTCLIKRYLVLKVSILLIKQFWKS